LGGDWEDRGRLKGGRIKRKEEGGKGEDNETHSLQEIVGDIFFGGREVRRMVKKRRRDESWEIC